MVASQPKETQDVSAGVDTIDSGDVRDDCISVAATVGSEISQVDLDSLTQLNCTVGDIQRPLRFVSTAIQMLSTLPEGTDVRELDSTLKLAVSSFYEIIQQSNDVDRSKAAGERNFTDEPVPEPQMPQLLGESEALSAILADDATIRSRQEDPDYLRGQIEELRAENARLASELRKRELQHDIMRDAAQTADVELGVARRQQMAQTAASAHTPSRSQVRTPTSPQRPSSSHENISLTARQFMEARRQFDRQTARLESDLAAARADNATLQDRLREIRQQAQRARLDERRAATAELRSRDERIRDLEEELVERDRAHREQLSAAQHAAQREMQVLRTQLSRIDSAFNASVSSPDFMRSSPARRSPQRDATSDDAATRELSRSRGEVRRLGVQLEETTRRLEETRAALAEMEDKLLDERARAAVLLQLCRSEGLDVDAIAYNTGEESERQDEPDYIAAAVDDEAAGSQPEVAPEECAVPVDVVPEEATGAEEQPACESPVEEVPDVSVQHDEPAVPEVAVEDAPAESAQEEPDVLDLLTKESSSGEQPASIPEQEAEQPEPEAQETSERPAEDEVVPVPEPEAEPADECPAQEPQPEPQPEVQPEVEPEPQPEPVPEPEPEPVAEAEPEPVSPAEPAPKTLEEEVAELSEEDLAARMKLSVAQLKKKAASKKMDIREYALKELKRKSKK